MKTFKFLEPYANRPSQRFFMAGVGLREWMPSGVVHRPKGTWDWLIMFFHTPVKIEVDGKKEDFPKMTMMIWDDSQSHFYGHPTEKFQHSWIHCQGHIVQEAMAYSGLTPGVYPDFNFNPFLEKYLPLLYEERIRPDMDGVILENLFRCLLLELSRSLSPVSSALPKQLHEVKHFLETHYATPHRLDELCEKFSISKSHLISQFRKHLGIPPVDFLIKTRMEHARSFLLDKNLSVRDVASRVGYDDIYHFSKLFKKHMGNSPSSFRPKG